MFEVRFTQEAFHDLQSFIIGYEEGFFNLYRDTGLPNSDQIIEIYKTTALRLYESIISNIQEKLKPSKVFGRRTVSHFLYAITFYVSERLVIVYYHQDSSTNDIRWVERIGIDRKPIIF